MACILFGRAETAIDTRGHRQTSRVQLARRIRELQNVIERAVIISQGRALDFDLPAAEPASLPRQPAQEKSEADPEFLTEAELQKRERENLLVILEKTNWKIRGRDGEAELSGVKPTTLMTRMKKMGL